MLRAHPGAEEPAETETGHPEDGRVGRDPETTAGRSREDGRATELLRLQQEISGLREAFKRQEAHWAAAHRELRNQMDTLMRQNLELRAGLRASELRCLEAKKMLAGSVLPLSVEAERTDSGKTVPCEDRAKTLSRSLQDRNAEPTGRKISAEEKPTSSEDEKQSSPSPQRRSGRESPGPAARAVTSEDNPGPDEPGSSSSESGAGGLPAQVQTREATCSFSNSTEEPQVGQALGDSCKVNTFSKGTKKDTRAEKKTAVLRCFNRGVKEILPDQRLAHPAGAPTARTACASALEVVHIPNKQTEKFYPDGSKKIVFPDGTVKRLHDGHEETVFPDGTVVRVERNGDKTIVLSNGQREVHTARFKRREHPDGTVKTVYCNGRQETKYASGRVKVKDEAGNIILDRK